MRDDGARCLLFACDDEKTAETRALLLEEQGIRVTVAAERDACVALLRGCRWRFLMIDAGHDVRAALGVLTQARDACPDVPVLVLVQRGDTETAVQAMKAGAADCVETPIRPACLFAAIAPFCGAPARAPEALWTRLTRVEQIVLGHILDGRTNQQIANTLCRSPRTIEVHRRHVMAKLNAGNLIELVRQAMRAGMLNCSGGSESTSSAPPSLAD